MNFYAEELDEAPEVAYIAMVGFFESGTIEELVQRVQRIQEASPAKSALALDVRGVKGLEAEHYELLEGLQDQLRDMGWNLCFCNIPSQFQDFFHSGRMQRNFQVFDDKSDLLQKLQANSQEDHDREDDDAWNPIPVIFRTPSGIRLFQGTATNLDDTLLTVLTRDRNAQSISDRDLNPNLYFDSDQIQVVPKPTVIESIEEIEEPDWNYRIEVRLEQMDELDQQQVEEFFRVSSASS